MLSIQDIPLCNPCFINDPNAIVEINGFKLPKSGSQNIPLLVGKNLISARATAADGFRSSATISKFTRVKQFFLIRKVLWSKIAKGWLRS